MISQKQIESAASKSRNNEHEIGKSQSCACYYCLTTIKVEEITKWGFHGTDAEVRKKGRTALCPKCGIDALIPSSSGLPVDRESLVVLNRYWFTPRNSEELT